MYDVLRNLMRWVLLLVVLWMIPYWAFRAPRGAKQTITAAPTYLPAFEMRYSGEDPYGDAYVCQFVLEMYGGGKCFIAPKTMHPSKKHGDFPLAWWNFMPVQVWPK